MSYNKILIAVDNSTHAMHAAKKGFELAHKLQASVGLVFVIDRDMESLNGDLFINPKNSQVLMMKEAEGNIEQIIKLYNGIDQIFKFMPEGIPREEIINTAVEWNADLIVIGTHGRTGLEHLLMGSVAEYIVRHSSIPVMVVPKKK